VIEALGHREQERDDAERLLAMLRVTLADRIKDREPRATHYANCGRTTEAAAVEGAMHAYRDVLSLLGPEETYVDDGTEPF